MIKITTSGGNKIKVKRHVGLSFSLSHLSYVHGLQPLVSGCTDLVSGHTNKLQSRYTSIQGTCLQNKELKTSTQTVRIPATVSVIPELLLTSLQRLWS